MLVGAANATRSSYTLTIVTDSATNVVPGMTISGSASGSSGYTMYGTTRSFIGGKPYPYSRTNTDSSTHIGYSVTTTVDDPANDGEYVYFPDPATVNWGDQVSVEDPIDGGGSN